MALVIGGGGGDLRAGPGSGTLPMSLRISEFQFSQPQNGDYDTCQPGLVATRMQSCVGKHIVRGMASANGKAWWALPISSVLLGSLPEGPQDKQLMNPGWELSGIRP